MREFIDSTGVLFCVCVERSHGHIYYGSNLYSRWYGFYSLNTRLWHKMKMVKRNGTDWR